MCFESPRDPLKTRRLLFRVDAVLLTLTRKGGKWYRAVVEEADSLFASTHMTSLKSCHSANTACGKVDPGAKRRVPVPAIPARACTVEASRPFVGMFA